MLSNDNPIVENSIDINRLNQMLDKTLNYLNDILLKFNLRPNLIEHLISMRDRFKEVDFSKQEDIALNRNLKLFSQLVTEFVYIMKIIDPNIKNRYDYIRNIPARIEKLITTLCDKNIVSCIKDSLYFENF